MKHEPRKTIERLFHEARQLKGKDREQFLSQECGGDSALRRTIEMLLEEDETADDGTTPVAVAEIAETSAEPCASDEPSASDAPSASDDAEPAVADDTSRAQLSIEDEVAEILLDAGIDDEAEDAAEAEGEDR